MASLSTMQTLTADDIKKVVKYVTENYTVPGFMPIIDPAYICTPMCSRIGGYPYWNWDLKPDYPRDGSDQPMRLLCQFNFEDFAYAARRKMLRQHQDKFTADFTALLPESGLLQIFVKDVDLEAEFNPLDLNEDEYMSVFWPTLPEADGNLTPEDLKQRLSNNPYGYPLESFGFVDWGRHREWPVNRQMRLKFKGVMCVPHEFDAKLFNMCYIKAIEECLNIKVEYDVTEDPQVTLKRLKEVLGEATFRTALLYKLGINYKDISWCMGMVLGQPSFAVDSPIASWRPLFDERFIAPDGSMPDCDCLFLRLWTRDFTERKGFSTNFMAPSSTLDFMIDSQKLKQRDFSDLHMFWRHDYSEIYPEEPQVQEKPRRRRHMRRVTDD